MLRLKRASAGSGKTYQLAKTFIKLFLTHKERGKRRRLRSPQELRESLIAILAVTFTVKATAEMKLRIVEKLDALTRADKASTPEEIKNIDYLKELIDDTGASKDEIAFLAKDAIRVLLLHFSDFKVQTIDSFFQSILRTFAYEASLDDNFNMEIDTDHVISMGLDAALDSLITTDRKAMSRESLFWLKLLMKGKKTSSSWNVFAKKEGATSLYSELISEAKNLEKEDFQIKKKKIDEYFQNLDRPFRKVVEEVHEANLEIWRNFHARRKEAALDLQEELDRLHLDISVFQFPDETAAKFKVALADFSEEEMKDGIKVPRKPKNMDGDKFLGSEGKKMFKAVKRDYSDVNDSLLNDLGSAYEAWRKAAADYRDALENPAINLPWQTWLAYKELIPISMLVLEIADKKREYLENSNTLEISDTVHILSRIIGEDDTPFVYERMGSRLRHYLIDEFQDTSRMQWSNLRPLLLDSEAYDNENLIIGDAKQSIYRFRNADYRLINSIGQDGRFGDVVDYTTDERPADMARENTNFRSLARIVKFNNHIFGNLVNLQREDGSFLFSDDVKRVYDGVAQYIPSSKLDPVRGFVDIITYPALSTKEKENFESIGQYTSLGEPGFVNIVGLILKLKARGYDYKDIGILINSHDHGKAVIKMIAAYNSDHPDDQIPVISSENLLVASSLSVKIIVNTLEVAMKGLQKKDDTPSLMGDIVDEESLFDMLSTLQSQALPSVVEAIVGKFVPPAQKDKDAAFIATFQDNVIDYCNSHTSDIGSFLKWWKRKGKDLTINTPEDSEGVKIVTIHASKGLEYKCVVIPYANIDFCPGKGHAEWRWVQPDPSVPKSDLLPPFMPVSTKSSLGATAHSPEYEKFYEEVSLDNLNKLYVAFTRARNELYVFAPVKSSEENTGTVLNRLLEEGMIFSSAGDETVNIVIPPVGLPEGSAEYRFGSPLSSEEIELEKRAELEKRQGRGKPEKLSLYPVHADRKLLKFQEGGTVRSKVGPGEEDEEENDPRAEGTIKHLIMELIDSPEDLERAILTVKASGRAPANMLERWKKEIADALESKKDYGWFGPDVRVLKERSIVRKGSDIQRPDRIVVRDGDHAEVIDYKFGEPRSKHRQQVKDYCYLLAATGRFRSIKGYLWYVPSGEVVKAF